jgi:transcriptional regulator with XRE-family HTH domain
LWNGIKYATIPTMNASDNGTNYAITSAQVRAARGLVNWSRDQLAQTSGVPMRTLARFEADEGAPQARTVTAIRAALEASGVEFIQENGGGPGVRLRVSDSHNDAVSS